MIKASKILFAAKVILLVCFMLSFFLVFSHNAKAAVGMAVSPQKFDLVIFPGETFAGKIIIKNQSEISLPLTVKAVPFGAEEETGEMKFKEIKEKDPVFWFKFEKTEMILKPHEKREIDFEIKVPSETEPGGYYVFVYFEPRLPKESVQKPGPKTIPVLGIPFLISTSQLLLEPEKGKEFEVVDFSIPEKERATRLEKVFSQISENFGFIAKAQAASGFFFTLKKPSFIFVKIKNNDIYHIRPFGKIYFYNLFGKKTGELNFQGRTILPQKSRIFKVNLPKNLDISQLGSYRVKLLLKAQSPVRGEITFIKEPSFSFFPITNFYFLFVLFLILLGLFFRRKQIKLALKYLLKGKVE